MKPPVSVLMLLPQGLTVTGVTTWALSLTESLTLRGIPCGALVHGCAAGFREINAPFAPNVRLFQPQGLPRIEQAMGDIEPFARAYAAAATEMAGPHGTVCLIPMRHGDCFGAAARVTQLLGARVRLIGWQQNDSAYEDAIIGRYEPACAALVGVSEHIHQRLCARFPHRAPDTRRIWNSVRIPGARAAKPATHGRPLELVYTGRIEREQKRILALVHMSDALERAHIPHRITIVGDGPSLPELRRLAEPRADRIRLTGALDGAGVASILRTTDIFVLASRMEGLSFSMVEAMAHGCAVVATRTESGAGEAIVDGSTGCIVDVDPTGDDRAAGEALARAVARCATLGPHTLGAAAWARARDHFSLDRQAADTETLVRWCADQPARAWPADRPCAFSAPAGTSRESGSVPPDGAERLARTMEALRDRAVAVHGVGAHTHQLIHILAPHADHIACFTDDNPSAWGARLLDRPVVSPREAASLGATDVVLSSWIHERTLWRDRAVSERQGLRVHRVYTGETIARAPRTSRAHRPIVVSVHGPDVTSGVTTWGARMCARAGGACEWRMLIVGERSAVEDARSSWPGAERGHAHFVSWSGEARPTERIEVVRRALIDMRASAVVGNYVPEAYAAGALRGIAVIGVAHAQHEWYREVLGRAAGVIDAWWGVSAGARDRVVPGLRGVPTGDPIPCGIEIDPAHAPCRASPGPGARPVRLVFAGRLENIEKRAMDLAPLCDALAARAGAFELRIAGDGPAGPMVRDALRAHIASGRVRMLGTVAPAEMRAHYEWADALVLVSGREGMPVVVMEAMSAGCAIAITEGCGDAVGVVRETGCGVVVPIGAADALGEAIVRHAPEFPAMGERARTIASRRFDIGVLGSRCDARIVGAIDLARASTAMSTDAWRSVLALVELIGDATPRELDALGATAHRSIAERTNHLPGLWRMEERLVREALSRARAAGLSRLAIFPGGRHTARLGRALADAGEVVAIIDERAGAPGGPGAEMHGRAVMSPTEALALGLDGVIISTDQHESALAAKARLWGLPIVTLYAEPESLPTTPTRDAAA